ncbi:aminotransferase class I/II-fold pyridoxal phosphate-dependent enzyme [Micromonospora sp. NPDC049559]|uniref:MalY/PatB family protein n=1 Tax=Micromonospora sp. NPDC049559 TaxID=3155923 RepID=UPI00343047F9
MDHPIGQLSVPSSNGSSEFAALADALTEAQLRRKRGAKWGETPPGVLPAWVADPDLPIAPPVAAALRAAVDGNDLGHPYEDPAPARAWARWSARRYGWEPDVSYASGHGNVVAAMAACIDLLTAAGEPVIVPVPTYPPFLLAVRDLGRTPLPVPLRVDESGRDVFDLGAVAAALRDGARLVLLCSPHNPTGRCWSADELGELAELVVAHEGWLVSDEVFADVTLPGARHVPTASLGDAIAARTVTVTSASKAFGTAGLRYALAVAPDADLHARISHRRYTRGATASLLGAVAAEAAWRHGDRWMDDAVRYLDARRTDLLDALPRLPGVRCRPPEATYLSWWDLRETRFAAAPARELLARARVQLSDGEPFAAAGFARFNFALPRPLLAQALDRLAEAFRA